MSSENSSPLKVPVWNDTENDRLRWRAAEIRKLKRPATRCGGRRINHNRRHTNKEPTEEINFPITWDSEAARSCINMMNQPSIYGNKSVTDSYDIKYVIENEKTVRNNFKKEHSKGNNQCRSNNRKKATKAIRLQQFKGRRDLCGALNPNRT
tara:strand:- start:177 stop:632 length:456 start_codon:yes stop_codon:yes gene_type:complete